MAARLGWLSFLMLLLASCAFGPKPLTEEERARLGRIAVQSTQSATRTAIASPYTPGQAASATALNTGLEMAASSELGLLLAPAGMLVGGVVGGMRGTPKEESETAGNVLLNACETFDFQTGVRRQVIAAIQQRTRHPVVQAGLPGTGSFPRADSVLELDVFEAGLSGSKFKNANRSVFLRVRARLSSLPDRTVLYDQTWTYTRGSRTFNQWAAQDARAFHRELALACHAVGEGIAEEIFLTHPRRVDDRSSRKHQNDRPIWYDRASSTRRHN